MDHEPGVPPPNPTGPRPEPVGWLPAVVAELLEWFRRSMDAAGVPYDEVVVRQVGAPKQRHDRPAVCSLVRVESRLGWECFEVGSQRWFTAIDLPLAVVTTNEPTEADGLYTESVDTETISGLVEAIDAVAVLRSDGTPARTGQRVLDLLIEGLTERLEAHGTVWVETP
jgi:hypothetical protein